MTRLLALLLVAALICIAFSVQGSRLGRDWVLTRLSVHDGGYTEEQFKADLVANFNAIRASAGLPDVVVDKALETWLDDKGSHVAASDTQELLTQLQDSDLCYAEMYVTAATAISKKALLGEFNEAAAKSQAKHTSIGASVRPVSDGYGYEVVLVLGRKLKPFSPERLSARDANEFSVSCPHCKAKFGLHAQASGGGLFLRCPKCNMSGGVLATDALGGYRWANEFLVGYQPPALYPLDATREHEMFIVWNAVAGDCAYRADLNQPGENRDAWQTPLETMVRGQGDCEDTAILLTDWLIARGFNARVAIGQLRGGGHAWCVVRLDGVEYLLESTNASPNMNELPFVDRVGADYVPETMFDRDHIYVAAKGITKFQGRYFSDDWVAIKPRAPAPTPTQAVAAAVTPVASHSPHPVALRRPLGNADDPIVVQFPSLGKLGDIANGDATWQLTKPFASVRKE